MVANLALPSADLASVDLADPRVHAEQDLTEFWRYLRERHPVYWHPATRRQPGFWVVTPYDDVQAVFRDNDRFTSADGNVLETLLAGGDSAAGRMLAVSDGPRHGDLRSVLSRAFSPRALATVVEGVERTTRRLLEAAVGREGIDFAASVAAEIPLTAICDLLDVPHADRPELNRLTSRALSSEHAVPGADEAWSAKNEILLYFSDLADTRRKDPREDIVSLLVTSEPGGVPLSEAEIMFNCYSLILGGDETTRLSIIGGLHALAGHPAQWRALKDGTVGVAPAVEEILRWTTPALHAGRTARVDTELHGTRIAAGDLVTAWTASANRDERHFDHPERFDLARRPNKHLTFSYGPHFCLGAYLARVEVGAVLKGLRELVADIEVTAPPSPIYSNFLSGFASLPLTLHPDHRRPSPDTPVEAA